LKAIRSAPELVSERTACPFTSQNRVAIPGCDHREPVDDIPLFRLVLGKGFGVSMDAKGSTLAGILRGKRA